MVITDSIHATRLIFNSFIHSSQVHSATISKELRRFFIVNNNNSIEFWECPSHCDWPLFKSINKDTKCLHQTPLLLCKSSWDFSRKREYEDIICNWKMIFQASDQKGRQFLELVDSNNNLIKMSYTNGGLWLKLIGHSNSLCTRAIRAITNHTPTGEYRLHFFPKEEIKYPCGPYPIKSRHHILHECQRFNKYWNPKRDSLSHFVLFLEFNSSTFAFDNAIR